MGNIENEIRQSPDATIEILRDTLSDNKRVGKRKDIIILFLIAVLFGSFLFFQWSYNKAQEKHTTAMAELAAAHDKAWSDFLSQYEFSYEEYIEVDGMYNINNGSINHNSK